MSTLRDRILGALLLEPMTRPQLMRCLCVTKYHLAEELDILVARGDVRYLEDSKVYVRVGGRNRRASTEGRVAA